MLFNVSFTGDHMYQREIFRIGTPATVPTTHVYTYPYESTVSFNYPDYVFVNRGGRNDAVLSETKSIRRELSEIRSDIGAMKRQRSYPTYYVVDEIYPANVNPACVTCAAELRSQQYVHDPIYYCDNCQGLVAERAYSVEPTVRTKTPATTYQASYVRPYSSPHEHLKRQVTLNELQTQPLPSTTFVKHTNHWIPTAHKNSYPHRRWNLSVRHPEP